MFDALGLDLVTSRIESANERSQKVAQRLGMSVIRTTMWTGRRYEVHAVTREAWARQRAGTEG